MTSKPIFKHDLKAKRIDLFSATLMPDASAYLWNEKMMLQMNCRGYASAQHMQPEPAKYSYGQSIEAQTFMQPEHHYHSSHPGRFFYIKVNGKSIFSLPYEPMRVELDSYRFSQGTHDIQWHIQHEDISFTLRVALGNNEALEQWSLEITNKQNESVELDVYPCFSIGYASWMNQSANFDEALNGIHAKYVTPYQKYPDYYKNLHLMEQTVLLANTTVHSFDSSIKAFEGEGGLHNPSSVNAQSLTNSVALYQTPVAALQHKVSLASNETSTLLWLFGPVKDAEHAQQLRAAYWCKNESAYPQKQRNDNDDDALSSLSAYQIQTQQADFDAFVNTWLPRQIRYHCQSNRLTRDPQTRNFLQDHMVEVFTDPEAAKTSLLFALSQQSQNGAMPDGILLHPDATLKYINQIPHSDHNVWLFIYLDTYLLHTDDLSILNEQAPYSDHSKQTTVFEHLARAANYLYANIDHRSLSFIEQGDWCDPMNMVGKEGKGVSFWLTLASAYVFGIFANVCKQMHDDTNYTIWQQRKQKLNAAVNEFAWDGKWYARGICDNGRTFGISKDKEGKIYLNPQTFSMLSGAASQTQEQRIIEAVEEKLNTPFGVAMLAPAYTKMDADIGRLTQKFPGSAENGSVYNHASCFYAFALLSRGYSEKGYEVLKQMLVNEDDALIRGQLPNFVPNYYRGAYHQHPQVAGRSSHLFNTGTCAWYFRCVIQSIFGISKKADSIHFMPSLAPSLGNASISFNAFGASIKVLYEHHFNDDAALKTLSSRPLVSILQANGLSISQQTVSNFEAGQQYLIRVGLDYQHALTPHTQHKAPIT